MNTPLPRHAVGLPSPRALLLALEHFIPYQQADVMRSTLKGRELDDVIRSFHASVLATPVTHGQQGKGDDAIVGLHYFTGSADWYITERDVGDTPLDGGLGYQAQAVGLCCISDPELGYVSIADLLPHPSVNVDLYWTPKTVRECRAEWLRKTGR